MAPDPVSVPDSSSLVSPILGGQCDSQSFEEFFGNNLNARQIHSTFPFFPPRRKTSYV